MGTNATGAGEFVAMEDGGFRLVSRGSEVLGGVHAGVDGGPWGMEDGPPDTVRVAGW